jgi:hypothetical protein
MVSTRLKPLWRGEGVGEMSRVTKKQFLADVMHEIELLRLNSTEAERANLNFSQFDPEKPSKCIYGQMTGDCESKRAKELMDISCKRVFNIVNGPNGNGATDLLNKTFSDIKHWINGDYKGQTWNGDGERTYRYLSALEGYINLNSAKNQDILHYIKGEIKTLSL